MEDVLSQINSVPLDCISYIISLTSPRDTCMFSLTSTGFLSVADSDNTWKNFLPSDISKILSRAVDQVTFSSKKDLFVKLCKRHVLIDEGKLSFGLDSSSGKKRYMISARALDIPLAGEPFWRWISLPDSRFVDVVEKMDKFSLHIVAKIDIKALSHKTRYAAYLVYKVNDTSSVLVRRLIHPFNKIKLCTFVAINRHFIGVSGSKLKNSREWMEVEIVEFGIDNEEDGEVEIVFFEVGAAYRIRKGLIIQGIEIRPKY